MPTGQRAFMQDDRHIKNSCVRHCKCPHSSMDQISITHSHWCTDLQSLIKCLDHRDIVSSTSCSPTRLCFNWNASRRLWLQSLWAEMLTLKAAEKHLWRLLLTVRLIGWQSWQPATSTTDKELRLKIVSVITPVSSESTIARQLVWP